MRISWFLVERFFDDRQQYPALTHQLFELTINMEKEDLEMMVAFYFDISLDYLMTGKEKPQEDVKEGIQEAIKILATCASKM